MTVDAAGVFESERARLRGIAYRMLGSASDADDAVQTVWLRWLEAAPDGVMSPRAWLVTALTRVCIDELRAARRRRVHYVGQWLPEPLVDDMTTPMTDAVDREQRVAFAHLVLLDRLSPVARAALVLHEALDWSHREIASALGKSESACRQILARARKELATPPVATPARGARAHASGRRFLHALARGDVPALMDELEASAVLVSDGGGRVVSALNPIRGRDRIGRLLAGLLAKRRMALSAHLVSVNGEPGLRLDNPDGSPNAVVALGFTPDGEHVAAVYIVRNPDKLGRDAGPAFSARSRTAAPGCFRDPR